MPNLSDQAKRCLGALWSHVDPHERQVMPAPRGQMEAEAFLIRSSWRRAISELQRTEPSPLLMVTQAVGMADVYTLTEVGHGVAISLFGHVPAMAKVESATHSLVSSESSFSSPFEDLKENKEKEVLEEWVAGRVADSLSRPGLATLAREAAAALLRFAAALDGPSQDAQHEEGQGPRCAPRPVLRVSPPQDPTAPPDWDHKDRRGWTGHDCVRPCPAKAEHGDLQPRLNRKDDSWFGACRYRACGAKVDPATLRRAAAAKADRDQKARHMARKGAPRNAKEER